MGRSRRKAGEKMNNLLSISHDPMMDSIIMSPQGSCSRRCGSPPHSHGGDDDGCVASRQVIGSSRSLEKLLYQLHLEGVVSSGPTSYSDHDRPEKKSPSGVKLSRLSASTASLGFSLVFG